MSAGHLRPLPPPPESHVAQQSRRDKLRVQPSPNSDDPISDLLHVRDVVYGSAPSPPAMFTSSTMLDFSEGSRMPFMSPSASAAIFNESSIGGGSGFPRSGDVQQPPPSCEWASPPPPFVPSQQLYYHQQLKPSFLGYSDESGELHFANQGQELPPIVAHEHVRSSAQPCPWSAGYGAGGNELLFLPSYSCGNGNPSNTALLSSSRSSVQWHGDGDFVACKGEDAAMFGGIVPQRAAATQVLSLSLSSDPVPELGVAPLEDRFVHSGAAGPSSPYPKFSMGDGSYGRGDSLQGALSSTGVVDARRGAGPLGPFTGYATILKSSKFSKPAQLLLEEFCRVITGAKIGKQCDAGERVFGASNGGRDAVVGQEGCARQASSASVSSSSLHSSAEAGGSGDAGSGACKVHRPEFQQKKATLLYLQEEVCRRYKQYHQQMQMVVSSFDSVAGLSLAAPYTLLALKSVSKHFRSLKNAISDQLQLVSKVLGEELISSPISSRSENMTTTRMKYLDQSLRKQKAGESSLGFMEHSQPVWRPQRGLPERAVSVLRAWLFEHFLHPYPTDMDKHMLASQTGLSRNQVSNWFINARVRLWKPMVEEIHMLETKGVSRMDLNAANKDTTPAPVDDGARRRQPAGDRTVQVQCSEPLDCTAMQPIFNGVSSRSLEPWHCDKRLRTEECGRITPTAMDGDLVSFSTYHHQHAMDIGGLGAVSLSLGLRHEDGRQDSQHIGHFGTTMLHDFVS